MTQGFDSLFAAYVANLARRRCAPSTAENARQVLPRFFDHLREESIHDPRRVREDHIVGFGRLLSSLIELCGSNRHHERRKGGSSEPVTNERRREGRRRAFLLRRSSVAMSSSRLSGRPFAKATLQWFQTRSSGLRSGA